MSDGTNAMDAPAMDPRGTPPARTRPLYWSVRRELWENRWLHLAPLGVAALAVVVVVLTAPIHLRAMRAGDGSASNLYIAAANLMLMTAFVVGAFYCTEALTGERRDRSILFWKSLPVSDRTTVLAKAAIPLVVLPLITLAVIVAVHVALLLLSTAALLVQGESPAPLWRELRPWRMWGSLLYGIPAMALWHAPIYGFLLLVSGWTRRAAALWVVLPLLAIGVLEELILRTAQLRTLVEGRVLDWSRLAFVPRPAPHDFPFHPLAAFTPGRFLASPALWIGLALAALFLAVAVWLRRRRGPL